MVFRFLHRVRLLFCHVPDHGQLPHLALVRLQKKDDPEDQPPEADQRPNQDGEPAQYRNVGDNAERDPQDDPRDRKKEVLERVEPDEPVLVVRFHDQKNNRRDDGDVSQHSRHVVRHASGACTGLRYRGCGSDPASTRCTSGSSVGDLCAAHTAKSHRGVLLSVVGSEGCNAATCARPLPSDAASYQKAYRKAINNLSRQKTHYISPACCAAKSPSSGSLNISPWKPLTTSTTQITTAASTTTVETSQTSSGPSTGMMKRTTLASLRATANKPDAPHSNRHCNEWKRTKRFFL